MPQDPLHLALLAALVLLVAVLYSSVGHAGASGYLAAMALMGVAAPATKPAALVMNILVAIVGTWRFASAGLVPWRLLAPLVAGSVPAAFVGGYLSMPTRLHQFVLGALLLLAAARLWWTQTATDEPTRPPKAMTLAIVGVALGALAGLTGVGGGIFLSPLLIFAGWEKMRRTAGASAAFILVNSVAGLLGYVHAGQTIPSGTMLLGPLALAGGLYGSWLGARRLPVHTLRRVLGLVLLLAGLKLLVGP